MDETSDRSAGDSTTAPPEAPLRRWHRLWGGLRSRFARQIALAAVAVGAFVTAGHFLGGLIGWWHAWELTAGGHKAPVIATAGADAPAMSLVVLPLASEHDDGRVEDWFADALLGELTMLATQLHGASVIGRDTAAAYKGKAVDPRTVAKELGVRYVVQGRLRREADAVHLNVALVDGRDGSQRWSRRFVVERGRVNEALEDVVAQLARHLQIELVRTVGSRGGPSSADQASAEELSMRGWALWFSGFDKANVLEALALFERAVSLDPNLVQAWGGVSIMSTHAGNNGWVADRQAATRRFDEGHRQLERLDADHYFTYLARVTRAYFARDMEAMLRAARAWTERYRHPAAFGSLAAALMFNGMPDEAVAAAETALRLSPRDPLLADWQYRLAMAHYVAGRYDQSLEWARTAVGNNPALPWPPLHAAALVRLGRPDEARAVFEDFRTRHPKIESVHVERRIPGTHPLFVRAREQLLADLRGMGFR